RLDPKFESQNLTFVRRSNPQAKAWEESQPYVETIRTLFRSLALEQIPQGYTLNRVDNQLELPFCEQNGLAFQFRNGQILQGHHFNVFVGVARKVSSKPVEFMGAGCGAWNVAAVTSWPHTYLEPGQATEVYVAVRQGASVAPTSTR